mgnify:CR=1 FL=1
MTNFHIDYTKNRAGVRQTLEGTNNLKLKNIQNFVPLYDKFFILNENNWNNINLKHRKTAVTLGNRTSFNNITCELYDSKTQCSSENNIFVKYSPLLDPIKYLVGKYDISDASIFNLPKIGGSSHSKINNPYNSAYTDSFFSFLTSKLLHEHNFVHGLEFYGSYLANLEDYKVNIYDDIEYIADSSFFNKHKGELFTIDDEYYDIVCDSNSRDRKKRLVVGNVVDDIECETLDCAPASNIISLNDLDSNTNIDELLELNTVGGATTITDTILSNSSSTCSSRSSYTDGSVNSGNMGTDMGADMGSDMGSDMGGANSNENSSENSSDYGSEDDGQVFAHINDFPVDVILLEKCKQTLDAYAFSAVDDDDTDKDIDPEEWLSIFGQIIMQLIAYQKVFAFTHNDLHTNNIMYNETDKQFLYYCFNNTHYKIPTYGKIWKIIDFGRAIYKVGGNFICSDSFFPGEDAATQYNCEPFYNSDKPRLEPNNSFDLCRLGCSLFDYFIDDLEWLNDLDELDDVQRLVVDWCTDDKNKNILYKMNGEERYPEFKLYKMIARNVHNHTPQTQIEKACFSDFKISKKKIKKGVKIMNIDELPVLTTSSNSNVSNVSL